MLVHALLDQEWVVPGQGLGGTRSGRPRSLVGCEPVGVWASPATWPGALRALEGANLQGVDLDGVNLTVPATTATRTGLTAATSEPPGPAGSAKTPSPILFPPRLRSRPSKALRWAALSAATGIPWEPRSSSCGGVHADCAFCDSSPKVVGLDSCRTPVRGNALAPWTGPRLGTSRRRGGARSRHGGVLYIGALRQPGPAGLRQLEDLVSAECGCGCGWTRTLAFAGVRWMAMAFELPTSPGRILRIGFGTRARRGRAGSSGRGA